MAAVDGFLRDLSPDLPLNTSFISRSDNCQGGVFDSPLFLFYLSVNLILPLNIHQLGKHVVGRCDYPGARLIGPLGLNHVDELLGRIHIG